MNNRHLPNRLTAWKKYNATLLIAGFLLSLSSQTIFADELIISTNGSDSANTAVTSQTTETNVTQTNNADLNNNVQVSSDTGGNIISDTSNGSSSVQTGDAAQNVTIQNQANQSEVSTNCCPTSGYSTTISSNGSGSTNTASQNTSAQTNVTVTQNATIKNNITGAVNTGKNRVSDTSGDVTVRTGDVASTINLVNSPINITKVSGSAGLLASNLYIKGNGSNSYNSLSSSFLNPLFINTNNYASIDNNIWLDLTTGANYVDDTNGIVKILTGDIFSNVSIKNHVNKSFVDDTCLCVAEVRAEEKPTPTPSPVNPSQPSNPSNGGGQITPHAASTESPSIPIIFGLSKTSGDISWELNPTIIALFFILSGMTFLVSGLNRKITITFEVTL